MLCRQGGLKGNPEPEKGCAPVGWSKRGNLMFFYRRRRVGGRLVTSYVGRGPTAQLAADLEALQRRQREAGWAAQRIEKQRWKEADTWLLRLTELTRLLVKDHLRGLGYHQHARSEWRRKLRGGTPMAATSTLNNLTAEEQQRLHALLAQAQAGDRNVAGQLQEALDQHPDLWRNYGDIAKQALLAWIALTAGKDLLLEESLKRSLEALRQDLAEGTEPTPLERLLIERIVSAWLQANHADAMVAAAKTSAPSVHGALAKRQESSQRRLLAAIRELAVLRKLTRRALSPMEVANLSMPETSPTVPFGNRMKDKQPVCVEN
jgi:hypothetical protein